MKSVASFGVAQALVLGLGVGLVLSSASCGTKPPVSRCNRNTCPDGCCSDEGECFGATDAGVQSPQACGLAGVTCVECTANQVCAMGQCRLGSTGGGTGGSTGGGTGGSTGGGTGVGGGSGGGMSGDGGTCNATTCASGCCNAAGGCVMPAQQNFTRCGSNGAACQGCPNGQACGAKADGGAGNVCAVPNCSACLDTAGNCRTDKNTMTDNNYCGAMGTVCARCDTANGQMCQSGRCVGTSTMCNATNCDGCCAGNTCIGFADGGTSNAQCGKMATACTTCTAPATCDRNTGNCMGGGTGGGGGGFPGLDGGFLPTCDVMTCPTGCCSFFSGCVVPGTPDPSGIGVNCGMAGDVCKLCVFAPDCATGMALGLCF